MQRLTISLLLETLFSILRQSNYLLIQWRSISNATPMYFIRNLWLSLSSIKSSFGIWINMDILISMLRMAVPQQRRQIICVSILIRFYLGNLNCLDIKMITDIDRCDVKGILKGLTMHLGRAMVYRRIFSIMHLRWSIRESLWYRFHMLHFPFRSTIIS